MTTAYADALYPFSGDPFDGTGGDLLTDLRHAYARAIGLDIDPTSPEWAAADLATREMRRYVLVAARREAFFMDALAQSMTAQEAYDWVTQNAAEPSSELVYPRALVWGVDPDRIIPYPVRPVR